MNLTVCLVGRNLPIIGGHLWVHLNWALGLRALGCRVIWLDVSLCASADKRAEMATALRRQLEPFGFAECLAFEPKLDGYLDLEAAAEADLALDLGYVEEPALIQRFKTSVLIDLDPGLTQCWMAGGQITPAPHNLYFTIGETVGTSAARFPDCGLRWHYTPPPVFLPAWPPASVDASAPYTTITSWWGEWVVHGGEAYANDKRSSFLEVVDLPSRTSRRLELAIALGAGQQEWLRLEQHGWRVREASQVSATAERYRAYIRDSRGEFSCAKPSCVRLAAAWVSDRTLCYLASGRPAIVQHTGPSGFLPDAEGLFRFQTVDDAIAGLEAAEADYERHARAARSLAEEYFDAEKVIARLLERAAA